MIKREEWKPITEVYEISKDEMLSDYTPLLESFGYNILHMTTVMLAPRTKGNESLAGDIMVLFGHPKDRNQYGLLILSFGSCFICDILRGAQDYDSLAYIRSSTHDKIVWINGASEMLTYLHNKDWEGLPVYQDNTEKTMDFVREAGAIIMGRLVSDQTKRF